jgi:hypothetical protein
MVGYVGYTDRFAGTLTDLESLAAGLHDRGIVLCVDLVLNHTAREHERPPGGRRRGHRPGRAAGPPGTPTPPPGS